MKWLSKFTIFKRRTGIIALLSCCWLGGCGHTDKANSPFRWPSVSHEVDSLCQEIDCAFFNADRQKIQDAYDGLTRLNRELKNDELSLRLDFFKARIAECDGDEEGCSPDVIRHLLDASDSTIYPYLYNRIAFNFPNDPKRNVEEYDRLCSSVDFFRKKGDSPMTAMALIHLGNLLKDVRDPQGALSAYNSADSLLRHEGFEQAATFNSLNRASTMLIAGDSLKADELMVGLEKNPLVRRDTGMWMNVLHNLYVEYGHREALDTLYSLQGDAAESLVETFMSNACLNEGKLKEAIHYARRAAKKAREAENRNDYGVALYALSDALGAAGDSVGAYRSLLEAVELTDEIRDENEPSEIKDQETARIVSVKRLEKELEKSRGLLRLACIGLILLTLIIIAWIIVRFRISILKRHSEEERKRSDRLSRKLTATQIAMDETSKVLDNVSKALDDLKSMENASQESQTIASTVHTHKARNDERESFIETFSALHPEFSGRLKERSSSITEPDIRIASYIVSGMDNKHIAATLGIRPESVKQARWRLRTKLGISKGDSLEDTLRAFNT